MKKFKTYQEFETYIQLLASKSMNNIYVTDNIDGTAKNTNHLCCEFKTGGVSGGSCWGTDTYEFDGDSVDYNAFDHMFYTVFEDYEMMDLIRDKYIDVDDSTHAEMYGNYTNYTYLFINLKTVYDDLISLKAQRLAKLNKIFNQ